MAHSLVPLGQPLTIDVVREPGSIAEEWRSFAVIAQGTGYQGHDWVTAWLSTIGRQSGVEPAIVTIRAANGPLVGLVPLGVVRWKATRIVQFLGGKHSNFNLPLFLPNVWSLSEPDTRHSWTTALARDLGPIDALALRNQPARLDGHDNPMAALFTQPAEDDGFEGEIGPSFETLLERETSAAARKKWRKKEKQLQSFGAVRLVEATDDEAVGRALDAFLLQKARRFETSGIGNPFVKPGACDFLREAARPRGGGPGPLRISALMAGDRIVATFGTVDSARRRSGMINSIDGEPEISRCSPGELLLIHALRKACADGLSRFDLGVGDARYKHNFTPHPVPLFDSYHATSAAGAIVTTALALTGRTKRAVKRRPGLNRLAERLLARMRLR